MEYLSRTVIIKLDLCVVRLNKDWGFQGVISLYFGEETFGVKAAIPYSLNVLVCASKPPCPDAYQEEAN